jgi:hypothetical protein
VGQTCNNSFHRAQAVSEVLAIIKRYLAGNFEVRSVREKEFPISGKTKVNFYQSDRCGHSLE